MNARSLALSLISLVVVQSAAAQTTPVKITGATPAECTKNVADWRTKEIAPTLEAYRTATPENKAAATTKYSQALAAVASQAEPLYRGCAAAFNLATIPAGQLMDLVSLYGLAKDTANARRATDRLLTAPDLPPAARVQALTLAMNQEYSKATAASYFGVIAPAEKLLDQIDQVAASAKARDVDSLAMMAHSRMLGSYEYLDVADGLYKHANAVLSYAKKLNKPSNMISAYSSLARSFADRLFPDSALRILDNAEKELGAPATASFKGFRERYALIGTPAPLISADWWINTSAKAVVTPAKGKVTLIEFTAHWCGPCKNSYPGLRSVAEKFKGKAFEGAMVTSLYGYVGTQKNLNPEQEVAADRIYFGTEHEVPFPVAINAPPKNDKGVQSGQPKPDMEYKVGGIPQIMIVDKKGVIRQIVTGWDQGNTARFTAYIEKLLAEPN